MRNYRRSKRYFDDSTAGVFPPLFVGWAHFSAAILRVGAKQIGKCFDPSSLLIMVTEERVTHAGLTPTRVGMLGSVLEGAGSNLDLDPMRARMVT